MQDRKPMREQAEGQQSPRPHTQDEGVQVSLPNNDRPEGPFEHSGETARWTKEEKEEVEQRDEQQAAE